MDCQALTDLKKYVIDNIPGILAFLVSALSLWVSWVTFRRDQPKLKLHIYPAEVWGGQSLAVQQSGLGVDVINPSTKAMKVGSIGGRCRYFGLRTWAIKVLGKHTPKEWKPYAFIWDGIHLDPYLRPNGIPAIIQPGDRITFIIPNPTGKELGKHIAEKASSLHIFDGIGNMHHLKASAFKYLRRTYAK